MASGTVGDADWEREQGERLARLAAPQAIAEAWGLTNVAVGRRFRSVPSRAVFELACDQGSFALKADIGGGGGGARLEILTYLARAGYASAPTLRPLPSGELALTSDLGSLWLLELIPRRTLDGSTRPDSWRDLGRAAAQLNAHRSFDQPFGIPIGGAVAELRQRVSGHPFEADYLRLLDRLPPIADSQQGLIHGEINEANSGRRGDGEVVLLDWDQAGHGATALDYGYPLIIAFIGEHDLDFDADTAHAFYSGYLDAGGSIDKSLIFNAALFHALRYMWWRDFAQRRWRRICWATDHEDELLAALP